MTSGIMLYGPPASGKDTITDALGNAYRLVPRRKAGPGRTAGYRMTTAADLDALRAQPGEVLWQITRYHATYVLTRSDVAEVAAAAVPVVHVGQVNAISALITTTAPIHWTLVELWCPRQVAVTRIATRGTGDDADRMAAYDATPRLRAPDLIIDTSVTDPSSAARSIRQALVG